MESHNDLFHNKERDIYTSIPAVLKRRNHGQDHMIGALQHLGVDYTVLVEYALVSLLSLTTCLSSRSHP